MNISRPFRDWATAVAIGATSGTVCWAILHRLGLEAADFTWAHHAARILLEKGDPYANMPAGAISYPMPAAIVALPFSPFPPDVAGGLFFGISSALLALGLVRQGPQRLLIFLAFPFASALITAQWTPLLMSTAFFPLALVFCLAKPHIGLPIALTHLSRKGVIAAAALLFATFLLQPRWPLEWIPQLHPYQHFFPLLTFPGPLLALALWRWRDRDAWLLLTASVMPQRWFYDCFFLWLIPKTRRSIIATVGCSWITGLWRWYHMPHSMNDIGRWSVLGFYLPMLVVILLRNPRDAAADNAIA